MASVRKRGNTYQITVSNGYDCTGKKIIETTTYKMDLSLTPKKQEKALDVFVMEFEQKVKSGKYYDGEKITFKEFSEKWLEDYAKQNLQLTTQEVYQDRLERHIIPEIGHLKMVKIMPMTLQVFYNKLFKDGARSDGKPGGLSLGSVQKINTVISSILSTAVMWGVIDSNPCRKVTVSQPAKDKVLDNKVKYFNAEQAERFLQALEMSYTSVYKAHGRIDDTGRKYNVKDYMQSHHMSMSLKVFFQMALFGGFRRGELIALTWDDIDFSKNTIHVTKSSAMVKGKMITKETKTKGSVRDVVLPLLVMESLKKWKAQQNMLIMQMGEIWNRDGNFIFTRWDGKQMNPSTPTHAFKSIVRKYNLTVDNEHKLPDINLHCLRHTTATLLISKKTDISTVSTLLGHARKSTTMDIYTHSLKEANSVASDTLEGLLLKKSM